MKIIVCIKQVPGTTQVAIDEKTGTLKRDGIPSKMNPFDLYALETALRIASATGGTLTALTMGPPQAQQVLREAFMMGADDAVLLSDRKFGGADVLATSYTLAQGIRKIGPFDLIVCGRQTTDGDTAQIGAELAEHLNIPHVACVCEIPEITPAGITLKTDLPGVFVTQKLPLPALITVNKGIFEPRLPSFRRKLATADRQITVLTLPDLPDTDPKHYGLNGSPTQVKRIFPPDNSVSRIEITGTGQQQAETLAALLDERKFLQQ